MPWRAPCKCLPLHWAGGARRTELPWKSGRKEEAGGSPPAEGGSHTLSVCKMLPCREAPSQVIRTPPPLGSLPIHNNPGGPGGREREKLLCAGPAIIASSWAFHDHCLRFADEDAGGRVMLLRLQTSFAGEGYSAIGKGPGEHRACRHRRRRETGQGAEPHGPPEA